MVLTQVRRLVELPLRTWARTGTIIAICLAALFMTTQLRAQVAAGIVTGTVTDSSGAVIPGANVRATSTNTGGVRTTVSNSTGYFSIPALPPGPYTLEVSASGFEGGTSSIVLSVGQTLNVPFLLQIGSASEKVEVVANESTGLETQDHELTSVMESKTLENMPELASYRNATFYAQTSEVGVMPGSMPGASNINSNVSQYNAQSNMLLIGGQGFWSSTYLLDGVVDMSYFDQTATVNTPADATEQVEIIRNSANARYDGATALNAITKSGTTSFHGRLYEQLQNNQMNARGWNAGPLSEVRYNQFGANAGWTVPYTHKKLFFFVDYQGFRQVSANFLQAFLPTQAERNGDFSADLAANSSTGQPATTIYDPTTFNAAATPNGGANALQPFSYMGQKNVINPALISPLAKAYLKLIYPLPNGMNTASGNNYGSTHSRTQFHHDNYLYRLDYNKSERDHIYGAYDTNNPEIVRSEFVDDCVCAEPNQLYGTDIYLAHSHVFSPTLVNTARVGYARSVNGQTFGHIGNGTDYFHSVFGLTGLTPPPSMQGWPAFNPGGYSGPSGSPLSATQNMYEYSDEVNLVKGKHSIFLGGEFDWVDYNAFWYTGNPNGALSTNGQYTYNGSTAAAWQRPGQWLLGSVSKMPAANILADWMLGYYTGTNASAGSQVGYFHQRNIMPYIQDDWHFGPRLTFNLGLRYDYYSPVTEQGNHAGTLDPVTGKYTEGPWDPNRLNFSPRAGFAYALNDKTSIHGGGGIYYYQFSYYDLQGYSADPLYNTGLNSVQTQANPVIWPSSNTAANPNTGAAPGQQEFFTLQNAEAIWAKMPKPTGVFVPGSSAFSSKMPTSYSEQWNLAIQRSFGRDWLLTVDYLGSSAHHIYSFSNINQASLPSASDPNPASTASINSRRPYQAIQGNIIMTNKWGQSHYHGFEAQLKKRFSNGFQMNTNIVWQKSMDYGDSDRRANEAGLDHRVDYGPSDFTQRYVYKASAVYELPFGRNKHFLNGGKWWENQLGGWRLSGFSSIFAGPMFNITAGDTSNTGGGINNRALETCNGNNGPKSTSQWFNTSCYAVPAQNTFGNERRNNLIGPRNTSVDLSIQKEFEIRENLKFQWRTDAYSALNHPLLTLPNATVGSSTFGKITSASGARVIQLSAKVLW
jgi:hypothetical protein